MLLLLFHIKNDCYAISTTFIREVIPYLTLKPVQSSYDSAIGTVNYRGTKLPVIDLCMLLNKQPCTHFLSSRIMVAQHTTDSTTRLIGLLAEQVTETVKIPASLLPDQANLQEPHYIKEGVLGHNKYQLFVPDRMVPAAILDIFQAETFHDA